MSSRLRPLLIGGIAFATVFVLIVVVAVVVIVVVRPGAGPDTTTSTAPTGVDSTVPATDASASTEPGEATPTETAEFCWLNSARKVTTPNQEGELRAGGIKVTIPEGWKEQRPGGSLAFLDDADTMTAPVEETWVSLITISKVTWQTGYEYPGAQKAAQRILDCSLADTDQWEPATSKRHMEEQVSGPVEVAGLSGYQITGTLVFDETRLTRTTGTFLTVIVLDTPQGPTLYYSDIAKGVPEHEAAGTATLASITAI